MLRTILFQRSNYNLRYLPWPCLHPFAFRLLTAACKSILSCLHCHLSEAWTNNRAWLLHSASSSWRAPQWTFQVMQEYINVIIMAKSTNEHLKWFSFCSLSWKIFLWNNTDIYGMIWYITVKVHHWESCQDSGPFPSVSPQTLITLPYNCTHFFILVQGLRPRELFTERHKYLLKIGNFATPIPV